MVTGTEKTSVPDSKSKNLFRTVPRIIEKLETSNADVIGMFDVWKKEHLPKPESNERRVAMARHRYGCHCLYIDWHVDYVAAEDMTEDMWRFKK